VIIFHYIIIGCNKKRGSEGVSISSHVNNNNSKKGGRNLKKEKRKKKNTNKKLISFNRLYFQA